MKKIVGKNIVPTAAVHLLNLTYFNEYETMQLEMFDRTQTLAKLLRIEVYEVIGLSLRATPIRWRHINAYEKKKLLTT